MVKVWIFSLFLLLLCGLGQATFLSEPILPDCKNSLLILSLVVSINGDHIIIKFNQQPAADRGSKILQSSTPCSSHI